MKATSVRLDDELMEQIDHMAEVLARPRSWVITEALKRFVDQEEWFHEAVKAGLKDSEEGRVVDHAKVKAWVESWGTAGEVERPKG